MPITKAKAYNSQADNQRPLRWLVIPVPKITVSATTPKDISLREAALCLEIIDTIA